MAKGLCKTPGPWNVAGKSLEIEDFHGKIIYIWRMFNCHFDYILEGLEGVYIVSRMVGPTPTGRVVLLFSPIKL